MIKNIDTYDKILQLKKHVNRIGKDGHKFYRYLVSIDPELVKDLDWKPKQKLKAKIEGKKLIIERE